MQCNIKPQAPKAIPEWLTDGQYLRCPWCHQRNYPRRPVEQCQICGNEARL